MASQTELRKRRIATDKSLRQVAFEAGISATQLSQIEQGKKGLTLQRLYSISVALGDHNLAATLEPFLNRA